MSKTEQMDIAFHDAKRLAEAGLLTGRQAQAYAFRVIHGISRRETADALGVSKSYVDNLRSDAIEKIDAASETVAMLDEIDKGDTISPGACAECGGAVDEFTIVDGEAVCLDCAGIENV